MSERMIDRLSQQQLNAILNALPIEFIFVDDDDRLQYCNKEERQAKMEGDKILGKDIRACHKPESLPRTEQILRELKSGERDEDEFWIDGLGTKLLNRFLAVRDEAGKYLGCVEYLLDFTAMENLAEAKKDSHRHAPSQPDASKAQDEH
jgi:DUF438 domain-containing protein